MKHVDVVRKNYYLYLVSLMVIRAVNPCWCKHILFARVVQDDGMMRYLVIDDLLSTDQYHDTTELGLFHRILFFVNFLAIMRRLSSFTLVEMIIVIVIVSIMLLISLNISSSQTKILRFKIARETFITNYNTWLIRAITTNSQDISLYLDYNNDNNPSYQPIFAE